VHVIELTGAEDNRGLLDPLVVAPEALREDLASTYLVEILPEAPARWKTQIRAAVKHVLVESVDPSCQRVLAYLRTGNDAAREAGAELEVWADSGLGRLAFGDGMRAAARAELPVTTIKAPGLALPPPGVARADYDDTDRLGVATQRLLVGYAMRLVQGDRRRSKVVHMDEAHAQLRPGVGRQFLDRINRMGRSMNATLMLSTQLLAEVGDLESLIGTRLIFGQETEAEARAVLPIVGLDPTNDRLVKMLRDFTAGRCLMRGIDDRVAAIQIDVMDPEILRILDTNPSAHAPVEVMA
jgi:hypothetical protein